MSGWKRSGLQDDRREVTIAVEIQGEHGVVPPERDICQEVRVWLSELDVLTEETEEEGEKQPYSFGLQIECRKIPANRDFRGVRAITIPSYNYASIELRVRPPQSQYQWKCHLIFPSETLTADVFVKARPAAAAYVVDNDTKREQSAPNRQVPPDIARRQSQTRKSEITTDVRNLRQLVNRATLKRLCAALKPHVAENRLSEPHVQKELAVVLGAPAGDCRSSRLLSHLVNLGVLDPVMPVGSRLFTTTLLFDEYEESYRQQQEQAEKERLTLSLQNLKKLRSAAERDLKKSEERTASIRQQIISLEEKIQITAGSLS